MAVKSFDNRFSMEQDCKARLGANANRHITMSARDRKSFQQSDFMQMVEKINTLSREMSAARDSLRAETDPSFRPSKSDFKVDKVFQFDKTMNYYCTLGVTEYETQANIIKAYKDLSLIYHPDKTSGMSQDVKDKYATIFIQLKNAYVTLSDNAMRRQYDCARDKEIASCQVRNQRMPQHQEQFDPKNSRAVLERGGPKCLRPAKKDGRSSTGSQRQTVQASVQVSLETFVFGGREEVVQSVRVKDPESADLGILEFEQQDRVFRIEVPPGADEPFALEFEEQGNEHEDAPPDTLRFMVTSSTHSTVERQGCHLRAREPQRVSAGPYVSAELASVRGRHVLIWGLNPFFQSSSACVGELHVRILGEGAGKGGDLMLTLSVEQETTTCSPAPEPAVQCAQLARMMARQQRRQTCEVQLAPVGAPVTLRTEPKSSIALYSNLGETSGRHRRAAPRTLFAISFSSRACARKSAVREWRTLKAGLLPLLQLSGFTLLEAARGALPRSIARSPHSSARSDIADGGSEERGLVDARWLTSWKLQGNEAFARGEYWLALSFYTKALEHRAEAGEETVARLSSNRAACFFKIRDYSMSLADARGAAELRPGWTKAWARVGLAAAMLGSGEGLAEALRAYMKIVELESRKANIDALHTFVREQMTPDRSLALEMQKKGNSALHAQEWSLAVAAYTVGIATLDVQTSEDVSLLSALFSNRSAVFAQLAWWDAAASDAREAIDVKPYSTKSRCRLGVALLGLKRTEQAYKEFAEGLQKDQKSAVAKQGRDACLVELLRGRSLCMERRLSRRLVDAGRRRGSARVFAISDLHLDHGKKQWAWLELIDDAQFRGDALIVAGDLAWRMQSIVKGLTRLKSRFRRVFYTLGADDLRATNEYPDSIAKLHAIMAACEDLGVDMFPAAVSEGLYVVPMLSWYSAEFDRTDPHPDGQIGADSTCRWPIDVHHVWKYMLKLNEHAPAAPWRHPREGTVITFSHFLPRYDLPFHTQTEIGTKMAKFQGCEAIDTRLRAMASKLHVYGRSHILHAAVHDGVAYVNQPLGYPQERALIHRGEERALLMQVHDGDSTCMVPWDSVMDVAAGQQEHLWGPCREE